MDERRDDVWIEHDGKGMPVDPEAEVEFRFRNRSKYVGKAGHWHDEDPCKSNWVFDPASPSWDIVAYRVVSK